MGLIHGENKYFSGGTQVRVTRTRQKRHSTKYEKTLNGYDDFNNYVIVGSFKATTSFRYLDVRSHVMTLEARRVVNMISQNNKEYNIIINPLCTISMRTQRTIIAMN